MYDHFCTGESGGKSFNTSEGWFAKFKTRSALHNVKIIGEATSDTAAAERYPAEFLEIIRENDHLPEQVFNADETCLFWKRMPSKTFISKDEKSASGFKAAKNRVTLMMCANASGDCFLNR